MTERRWPWLVAAGGLMLAAAATAGSTFLHWLPCRGAMLSGNILRGYAYGPGFSDACLRRMDSGLPFPNPPEAAEQTMLASNLGAVAVALAAVAWLVLILGVRLPIVTRLVALLPGVVTLIVLVVGQADARAAGAEYAGNLSGWLLALVDATSVVALVVLWVRKPAVRAQFFARFFVALWGASAFSMFHLLGEYIVMTTLSDANWDNPPGTGYLTVTTLVVSAVLMTVLTYRDPAGGAHPQAVASRPWPKVSSSSSG